MSRRSQRNILFGSSDRTVIWLDVEKRTNDAEPALTTVQWSDGLKTYVHDQNLARSAKARKLELLPWATLVTEIVNTAMATDSIIAAYTLHERDLLTTACPAHAKWIEDNYGNANVSKWFKKNQPEVYAKACHRAGEGNKPGLKDFLNQPEVGYPVKKYLRGVKPSPILKRLRELLSTRDGLHRKLTPEAKRDWARLIEYNQEDVLGMIHLVEYVRQESREPALDDA